MQENSPALPGLAGLDRLRLSPEPSASRYSGHRLTLGPLVLAYRRALPTPKKTGAFVTLWLRSASGPIRPLRAADGVDAVLIHVADAVGSGLFVFPFATLERRGVASVPGRDGKRGFRVYAPWVDCSSAQARRSREWQRDFFLELDATGRVDRQRLLTLLGGGSALVQELPELGLQDQERCRVDLGPEGR